MIDRTNCDLRLAVLFERIGPYHHARLDAAGQRGPVWAIEFSTVDKHYAWDQVDRAGSYRDGPCSPAGNPGPRPRRRFVTGSNGHCGTAMRT